MTRAVSSLQTHTKMALTLSEAGVELLPDSRQTEAFLSSDLSSSSLPPPSPPTYLPTGPSAWPDGEAD